MSRDLRDLLAEFAEAESRASVLTAPAPELEAHLLGRRVARRRALRAGAVAVTSAAAVVGMAVGVSALTNREDPPPPATTPTPSVTPTPTPTPSSTPTPRVSETPDVVLPPVTEHPLLPDAEPMPPGTFERTGPGWVLVARALAVAGPGDGPIERTYFYLLDPDGVRYEVPFDTERPLDLADWLPGTSTAVVQLGGLGDFTAGAALLDLESGEFTDLPMGSEGTPLLTADGGVIVRVPDEVRRYGPDGTLSAAYPVRAEDGAMSIDASRTRFAVAGLEDPVQVLDAQTLTPVSVPGLADLPGGRTCSAASWVLGSTLAVSCRVDGATTEYWLVPPDGSATRLEAPATPDGLTVKILDVQGDLYAAVPETLSVEGEVVEPAHVVRLADGADASPVATGMYLVRTTGGMLVGWQPDQEGESSLVVVDPRTGASRPALEGAVDLDQASGLEAVTGFVVAR